MAKNNNIAEVVITSRAEAAYALQKIAQLNKAIAVHHAAILKESAQIEAYALLIKNQEKALKKFAVRDVKNWIGKSLALPAGVLSFQTSPGKVSVIASMAKKLEDAVDLLADFDWGKKYIRRTPVIDKEAIIKAVDDKKLTPEQLAQAGLKVEKPEVFSYRLAGE